MVPCLHFGDGNYAATVFYTITLTLPYIGGGADLAPPSYYSKISFPVAITRTPNFGTLNIHPSHTFPESFQSGGEL